MSLIGISGKKGHGKDLVARIIQYLTDPIWNHLSFEDYESMILPDTQTFEVKRFADKLKDMVCILLGCTRKQLEDREFKEKELDEEWVRDPRDIEIWETIKDLPNYSVSSYGRIINNRTGKLLQQTLSGNYYTVVLYNKGKKKTHTVHSLVMKCFSNYVSDSRKVVINHIDNDPLNNKLSNLEVVTQRVNTITHKSDNHNIKKDPRANSYQVVIKQKHYGSYDSLDKAKSRRDEVLKSFGESTPNIKIKTYPLTPRLILQLLGTEAGRNIIHKNFWSNSLMSEYKASTNIVDNKDSMNCTATSGEVVFPNWIIPDMRFPNELSAVKSKGGITIRVNRPTVKSDDEHESETALDNATFDHVIVNDGTVEDLVNKVREILIKEKILS